MTNTTSVRVGEGRASVKLSPSPLALPLSLLVAAGVTFGLCTAVVNSVTFPGQPVASQVLGGIWLWIILPYIAAWVGNNFLQSFILAAGFVIPAVLLYYTGGAVATYGDPAVVGFDATGSLLFATLYSLAGTFLCAFLALMVKLAKSESIFSVFALISVPILVAFFAVPTLLEPPAEPGTALYNPAHRNVAIAFALLAVFWAGATLGHRVRRGVRPAQRDRADARSVS